MSGLLAGTADAEVSAAAGGVFPVARSGASSVSCADVPSFLRHLEASGVLASGDAGRALRLAGELGEHWDQVLTRLGLVTEAVIARELGRVTGLEVAAGPVAAELPADLNPSFLAARRAVLLEELEGFAVGVVDPFGGEAARGVRFALGRGVPVRLVTHAEVERLGQAAAGEGTGGEGSGAGPSVADDVAPDAERLADLASSEPVIRRVNALLGEAGGARASDLHLEPAEAGYVVRRRVDGVLYEHARLGRSDGLAVVSRVKILAGLDIAERRRPQDGRFTFPVGGRRVDLRVSSVPTEHGESVVLRLLDREAVRLDLAALGYSERQAQAIRGFLHRPHGLVLLTGPTGSGKTTSLYTFLTELSDGRRKILTIEDPIEYRLGGISQAQVDPRIGVTFASALRAFLRHDPDVLMVGEIRDLETARIAVQAALTGHLVLSTLHTNDAPSAVTRLRDLGIEDFLLAATLNGVVSQRLVGRICAACTGTGTGTGTNCEACGGTGRHGRVAIAEILEANDAVRAAIGRGAAEDVFREKDPHFALLAADACDKAAGGVITAEDAERVLGVPVAR